MCEHFKNRIESESIEGFESEFENQILNKQIFGFGLGFRYDLEDLIRYRRSHKQIFGFVFGSDRVDKDSIRFNISKLVNRYSDLGSYSGPMVKIRFDYRIVNDDEGCLT